MGFAKQNSDEVLYNPSTAKAVPLPLTGTASPLPSSNDDTFPKGDGTVSHRWQTLRQKKVMKLLVLCRLRVEVF